MELKANNDCSFTMSLVGYQFPELHNHQYDSNWLNVKIAVSHQGGSWSTIDPALLTYEVQGLIDWFRAASARKYDDRHLCFLEPCLSFRLAPAAGDPEKLIIELSHEFRPPWASEDSDEEYEIEFSLTSIDLIAEAQSLENQLRRYPQRTAR